ncbi:hypothetical protein [Streptomyces sp. NPDC049915]|uniref:hypothetical protein n=1 Tax=Streptomyces sp. NPDC049915 TaxID=3155510 RepID=UPI00341E1B05
MTQRWDDDAEYRRAVRRAWAATALGYGCVAGVVAFVAVTALAIWAMWALIGALAK